MEHTICCIEDILDFLKEQKHWVIILLLVSQLMNFDKTRGKINVQQSLMERIDGVKSTGLADEIIVEEYEGKK